MKAAFRLALLLTSCIALVSGCADSKPELPLAMHYRQSAIGAGYVLVFKNTSDRPLVVWLTFKRGGGVFSKTLRSGTIEIPAGSAREVGWMEGVQLAQGDVIELDHPDFQPGIWSIPQSFDY
jgi:hypothetical protein